MPVIIKSFMGIFFFSLVVFLGLGIVNYQMDVNRALHYKQDVIRELQNSNFSPSVMNACMKTGEDRDYEVSIDVSLGDGSHATYTNGCQAQDTADVSAYCIKAGCRFLELKRQTVCEVLQDKGEYDGP